MDFESFDFSDCVLVALIPLVIFMILGIHELGHFLVARLFKIPVDDVVVGVGREIWVGHDKKNTRWSVRLYPIWAHVQISGFDNHALPAWKRFLTVAAGPAINLGLPFFLFFLFFSAVGQPSTPAILTGVEVDFTADKAGLRPGDEVIAVDGHAVHRYRDVAELGYDHTRDIRYTVKRDGEILDLVVRPTFVEFIDVDGIRRADPRLGVQWRHKPTGLKIIHRINGVDTKDNIDKARDLIKHNFGRDVVVGIDSNDNKIHDYKVHLHETSNLNIDDPKHEDHELVFFGRTRDDFYLQTGFAQNVHEALVMNGDLIRKFAGLPFQLLPIDRYILSPDSAVYGDETWFVNKLYSLIYIASITSILLALFNLLPLPRLDGSLLIFYGIEVLTGKTLSRRKKALTLALSFFVFYCAVLLSNLDNAPGYIDSRMKKIQKFMDTKSEEQE